MQALFPCAISNQHHKMVPCEGSLDLPERCSTTAQIEAVSWQHPGAVSWGKPPCDRTVLTETTARSWCSIPGTISLLYLRGQRDLRICFPDQHPFRSQGAAVAIFPATGWDNG